jgi:heme-degrading monooxygenase HmoA
MIIVRNCFVAKPGNASKLAAQLKEAAKLASGMKGYRVLTDLTGDFNRVILEYEAENVAEFEARMRDYATNEAFRGKMKGYTDLYVTGSREILQVM